MQKESFTLQGARLAFREPPAAAPTTCNPTQNGDSWHWREPTRSQIIAIVKSPIENGVSKKIMLAFIAGPKWSMKKNKRFMHETDRRLNKGIGALEQTTETTGTLFQS